MRSRAGFGMVLYTEYIFILHTHSCNCFVVQVNMGNNEFRMGFGFFPADGEAVILGSNFPFPGFQVNHRMVDPPVPVVHFIGRYPLCQGNDLVAKTDAEEGFIRFHNLFSRFYRLLQGFRISWAI